MNRVESMGGVRLAEALTQNTCLEILELSVCHCSGVCASVGSADKLVQKNRCGDACAAMFGNALQFNNTLTGLSLWVWRREP